MAVPIVLFGSLARAQSTRATPSVFPSSVIVFYGSLAHLPDLARYGTQAIEELESRGYQVPTPDDPVRVYPADTHGAFDAAHAGGWRPGVISLREKPQGGLGPEIYLRHELMHEAGFRTCGGRLPLWAEQAAALSFSGEVQLDSMPVQPTEDELRNLREKIRVSAALQTDNLRTLSKLMVLHGWPREPCAVSKPIEDLLATVPPAADQGFSYLVMSLLSGRVLEARGDLETRYSPGSLLKIPYAAALRAGSDQVIGAELTASDTARLLERRGDLDLTRYRLLISMVRNARLGQEIPPEELGSKGKTFWLPYLGERAPDGLFPLEANLEEIALMLRASMLSEPWRFKGLSRNGRISGSTLYGEPEPYKRILSTLDALSKTGTASDPRGNPLVGHLMVAWPARDPLFLALFRTSGSDGASNLRRANPVLERWSRREPARCGRVRVRLMSLTSPSSWELLDECPSLERQTTAGRALRISTCGRFRVLSSAKGSRPERLVPGIIEKWPNDKILVLETDPETYADAVLAAEAQDLSGEARKALRAIIVWDGGQGPGRHPETSSLCDSTHCMVFRGFLPGETVRQDVPSDPGLLAYLDGLAARQDLKWISFSRGGLERWVREIPISEMALLVNEPSVLDLRRERMRSAEVSIHLYYPEGEETVPCEVFRSRVRLPSCPEAIHLSEEKAAWVFEGMGAGHGQGLSVEKARALGAAGHGAAAILRDSLASEADTTHTTPPTPP